MLLLPDVCETTRAERFWDNYWSNRVTAPIPEIPNQWLKVNNAGHVYIARAGTDYYKIGCSTNIKRRVKEKFKKWGGLDFVHFIVCDDCRYWERQLHRDLRYLNPMRLLASYFWDAGGMKGMTREGFILSEQGLKALSELRLLVKGAEASWFYQRSIIHANDYSESAFSNYVDKMGWNDDDDDAYA